MNKKILLILIPLMLVLFMSALDQTIVVSALPSIAKEFANSGYASYASWVTISYLITSSITTLLFGKLGDVYGRKTTLIVALVIFLLGSLLAGLSSSMLGLIIYRGLQGIGGGGLTVLCMSALGDVLSARERARYMGILGVIPAIALIIGPFLGGLLSDVLSWRWNFYINIPIGIVALLLIALKLELPKSTLSVKIDWLGSLLITFATTSLVMALSLGGSSYAWSSPFIMSLLGVGTLATLAFLAVEYKVQEPIIKLDFFKSSVFTISMAQFFLSTLTLFVLMVFVPMYFQYVRDFSATKASAFIIPIMVGIVLSSAISGEMITRTGKYKLYPVIGAGLIAVSALYLTFISTQTSILMIIAMLFLSGLGQGAMIQVALLAGQNALPYRYIGSVTGALNYFKNLGGIVGTAIFTNIYIHAVGDSSAVPSLVTGFGQVFFWMIPLMVASVVLGIVMQEKPLSDDMVKIASGEEEAPEY